MQLVLLIVSDRSKTIHTNRLLFKLSTQFFVSWKVITLTVSTPIPSACHLLDLYHANYISVLSTSVYLFNVAMWGSALRLATELGDYQAIPLPCNILTPMLMNWGKVTIWGCRATCLRFSSAQVTTVRNVVSCFCINVSTLGVSKKVCTLLVVTTVTKYRSILNRPWPLVASNFVKTITFVI